MQHAKADLKKEPDDKQKKRLQFKLVTEKKFSKPPEKG
jgi:hypothetical protein